MADIFISYSSQDFEKIYPVIAKLEDLGYKCWYAPRDIMPGEVYARAIVRGIKTCPIFLVAITENSTKSDMVLNEIEQAARYKKKLIPLFFNNLELPEEFSFYLRTVHWAKYEKRSMEQIVSILGLPEPVSVNDHLRDKNEEKDAKVVRPQKGAEIDSESTKDNTSNIRVEAGSSDKSEPKRKFYNFFKEKGLGLVMVVMTSIILLACFIGTTHHYTYTDDEQNVEPILTEAESRAKEILYSTRNLYVNLGPEISVYWASHNLGTNADSIFGQRYPWRTRLDENMVPDSIAMRNDFEGLSIPSKKMFAELMENCKWEWVDFEDGDTTRIAGYLVTGSNGNSIFLPAFGRQSSPISVEEYNKTKISGNYWTSDFRASGDLGVLIYFDSITTAPAVLSKSNLLSIRPVCVFDSAHLKALSRPVSMSTELKSTLPDNF